MTKRGGQHHPLPLAHLDHALLGVLEGLRDLREHHVAKDTQVMAVFRQVSSIATSEALDKRHQKPLTSTRLPFGNGSVQGFPTHPLPWLSLLLCTFLTRTCFVDGEFRNISWACHIPIPVLVDDDG